MELWFTMKNYGTMEKTMVLWTKLWYYTENYGTLIYEGKNHGRLPKTKKLWFIIEKTNWKYTNIIEVLNRLIGSELWLTMEKLWSYGKKLRYYGQIKTIVLHVYRELWVLDLRR